MSEILDRARQAIADARLDGLIVSSAVEDAYGRHSQNRRYLSGFSGSTGIVVLTPERAVLAVDSRYTEQAAGECPGFEIWPTAAEPQRVWFPRLLADCGLAGKRIGVSSDDMNMSEYITLTEAARTFSLEATPEIVPAPPLLRRMRARKTAAEIEGLIRAIEIGDRAYEKVEASLSPGLTERHVARAVEAAIREAGGDGVSFETIVASGSRSSMPHASPTMNALTAGDPLVIDMGALAGGYCSDLTRTTVVGGGLSARFRAIYEVVDSAQRAAIDGLEVGMSGGDADSLARSVIERAGFGEQFGHGLGHGIGLEVHESPYIGRTSEDVLDEGMVFTIEPGIYIPGWGGVRIEDVVVLEGGHARVLSTAKKLTITGVNS